MADTAYPLFSSGLYRRSRNFTLSGAPGGTLRRRYCRYGITPIPKDFIKFLLPDKFTERKCKAFSYPSECEAKFSRSSRFQRKQAKPKVLTQKSALTDFASEVMESHQSPKILLNLLYFSKNYMMIIFILLHFCEIPRHSNVSGNKTFSVKFYIKN